MLKRVWTLAKLTFVFATSMLLLDSSSPLTVGRAQTTPPKCNTSSSCWYAGFYRCYCQQLNCAGCFITNGSPTTSCGVCTGGGGTS